MERFRSLPEKYEQIKEAYSDWRAKFNQLLDRVPGHDEANQVADNQVTEDPLITVLGGESDTAVASSLGQVEQPEQIVKCAQNLGIDQKRYRQIADFSRGVLADLDKRGIHRRPYFSQVAAAYDITEVWKSGEPLCGLFDDTGMGKTFTALLAYASWARNHPTSKLIMLAENKPLQRTFEELRSLGISRGDIFCWSDKEFGGVSIKEKARELNDFRGSFVLLNYSSLRDQKVSRIIIESKNPDILAVDESHHIRERKHGQVVAERTSAIWKASEEVSRRGGKGILMSATPTVHRTQELDKWRKAWNTNTIPSIIRKREDYFEMPPISTVEIGVSGNVPDLPSSQEEVRKYFYEQMIREGSIITSWFVNQYLPEVLSNPAKRVVAFSPFVYEDRLTSVIGLHNIARALNTKGVRYGLIFGDGSSATDTVGTFLDRGQVLLASYGSGSESFTLNAPGLEVELVTLLPPPFYYQLYQAISRVYRPIGTGKEEIKVIMPQVVTAKSEMSITQRMYELLKQTEKETRQTEQTSIWDKVVSLLKNERVDRLIEKSTGELYLPHAHRAARAMQPDQAYLEFPPSLNDIELTALLASYKINKDQQTLAAIYSGIQSRTYGIIQSYFDHIAPENLDDVVQEIIGIALPGFIQEYALTSIDQIPFDLFLTRKVIATGRTVLKANMQEGLSLEEPFNDDSPFALRDKLKDPLLVEDLALQTEPQTFSDVTQEALEWSVTKGIILPREKGVLELRFGLDGNKGRTLEQIGDWLGLSRERIRKIEADALRKLRKNTEFKEKFNFF